MPVCVKLFIEHHNHTALSHYFGHLSRDAESWIKKEGKKREEKFKNHVESVFEHVILEATFVRWVGIVENVRN
jgi:hypothetical protein